MAAIPVRQLLFQTDLFYQQLPIQHKILFEDGVELTCYQRETEYTALFWRLFANYQETPITSKHHIADVLKGRPLSSDTHRKLCTNILKSIVTHHNLLKPEQKEPLLKAISYTISEAQKYLIDATKEDMISSDILDFIEVSSHPEIKAYRQKAIDDPTAIMHAYNSIIGLIKKSKDFDNNDLAKSVRAGMVRENQVLQCIAFRGYPSEIDGVIYRKAIWSNYVGGHRKLADFAMDSRTAAKSLIYSEAALQDSEYRARIFQLYGSVLHGIAYEDCGTKKLKPWVIKAAAYDENGAETYPGDLPMLIGKFYTETDGGPLKAIQGDEKHLIGKTIWVRSVLGCKHPNVHFTCHICAGELHHNVSRFDNLGHFGIVNTTQQFTQNILSIKHVNMSSVVIRIALGEFEKRFVNTGKDGDGYYLNEPKSIGRAGKLMVSIIRDEAPGLVDLRDMEVLDQISLPRISQTNHLRLVYDAKDSTSSTDVTVNVKMKKAPSMLSRDALDYIHKHGWSVDENNNFVIDMKDWDYEKPFLILQSKEVSFVDLADEVKSMIQSSQKVFKKRICENAPFVLLQELFDLVNSKLKINILSFEAMIYGLIVESEKSIAMGRHAENPTLGIADNLVLYRSLGPALGFESHQKTLFSPLYHYKGKRPDSVMDVFVSPQEVVEMEKRRGTSPHMLTHSIETV